MENIIEQGTTRQNTFFCINRERHTRLAKVVEAVPMEITVFGRRIQGWLITQEEPVIDKYISFNENLNKEYSFINFNPDDVENDDPPIISKIKKRIDKLEN